jgi:hypothetical protein
MAVFGVLRRPGRRPVRVILHLLPLVYGNPMYAEAYLQLLTDRGTSGRLGIAMAIPSRPAQLSAPNSTDSAPAIVGRCWPPPHPAPR